MRPSLPGLKPKLQAQTCFALLHFGVFDFGIGFAWKWRFFLESGAGEGRYVGRGQKAIVCRTLGADFEEEGKRTRELAVEGYLVTAQNIEEARVVREVFEN